MEEEPYLSEINNRHASKLDEWGWLEHGEYRLSLLLSTIPELDRSRSWFHLDLQVDLFVVIQFDFPKDPKEEDLSDLFLNDASASRLSA